jgi:hypothetical protein
LDWEHDIWRYLGVIRKATSFKDCRDLPPLKSKPDLRDHFGMAAMIACATFKPQLHLPVRMFHLTTSPTKKRLITYRMYLNTAPTFACFEIPPKKWTAQLKSGMGVHNWHKIGKEGRWTIVARLRHKNRLDVYLICLQSTFSWIEKLRVFKSEEIERKRNTRPTTRVNQPHWLTTDKTKVGHP